jgi:hypothetical protein
MGFETLPLKEDSVLTKPEDRLSPDYIDIGEKAKGLFLNEIAQIENPAEGSISAEGKAQVEILKGAMKLIDNKFISDNSSEWKGFREKQGGIEDPDITDGNLAKGLKKRAEEAFRQSLQ